MILREKDKETIKLIAKKTLISSLSIWAFGSRVNGDAHSTSDLDLVIVPDDREKLDIDELMHFKNALQKSNIPIFVQVVDWARIPRSFHDNILKNYEILT